MGDKIQGLRPKKGKHDRKRPENPKKKALDLKEEYEKELVSIPKAETKVISQKEDQKAPDQADYSGKESEDRNQPKVPEMDKELQAVKLNLREMKAENPPEADSEEVTKDQAENHVTTETDQSESVPENEQNSDQSQTEETRFEKFEDSLQQNDKEVRSESTEEEAREEEDNHSSEKGDSFEQAEETAKASIKSIIGSLCLVGLVFLFISGFHIFLQKHPYHGKKIGTAIQVKDASEEDQKIEFDDHFKKTFVMIRNVPNKGLYAQKKPGENSKKDVSLKNGQIVTAVKRGYYQGLYYYQLKDGTYITCEKKYAEPIRKYIRLKGYLAITYISSNGVNLRSYADFNADNIVSTVYVGDKVKIKAKIETQEGVSAYLTDKGYYMTTETKYFNDYTAPIESEDKDKDSEPSKEKATFEQSKETSTSDEEKATESSTEEGVDFLEMGSKSGEDSDSQTSKDSEDGKSSDSGSDSEDSGRVDFVP
ncbi:MAG: hypothetical protein U0K57_05095 [Lachnospiraceae bacterium]|nr:hypothetical protein [Lachnospiraceae bacterium]